MYTHGYIVNT